MATLLLAAVTDKVGPYAIVMGVGFLVGVYGHVIKSKTVILIGIALVGGVSAYFVFFVAKVT
ncbi:MAG TPA: hypothetical protein VGF81_07385 [Solirubrobacteraceae bacterium]